LLCHAVFLPDSRPLFVHIAELAIKLDPGPPVFEAVGIGEAVNILIPGLNDQFSAFVDKTPAVIQSYFGQAFTKITGIFKSRCDDLLAGMIDEGLHLVDLYPGEQHCNTHVLLHFRLQASKQRNLHKKVDIYSTGGPEKSKNMAEWGGSRQRRQILWRQQRKRLSGPRKTRKARTPSGCQARSWNFCLFGAGLFFVICYIFVRFVSFVERARIGISRYAGRSPYAAECGPVPAGSIYRR